MVTERRISRHQLQSHGFEDPNDGPEGRLLHFTQFGVFHEGVAEHVADAHVSIFDAAKMSGVDDDQVIGEFGHAAPF